MTAQQKMDDLSSPWAVRVRWAMELLWLLTLFLLPLAFVTTTVMGHGYGLTKVTLYRSLVGLLGALWIMEWGLTLRPMRVKFPRISWAPAWDWLLAQPSRWVLVAVCTLLASSIVSTLLSPSIRLSLWGSEPALDGYSFYNTLSHFIFFAVLATHLKSTAQLWRLFGVIVVSAVLVGVYAIVQYFGSDPFGVYIGGGGVVSSLGNPIFTAAFLLMVVPIALTLALRSRTPLGITLVSFAALTVLLLAIAFTEARGPWVGLAASLAGFLVLLSIALGWHTMLRAGAMLAASLAITWSVVTFVPPSRHPDIPASPINTVDPGLRVFSIQREVTATLTTQPDYTVALSGLRSRLSIWQGVGRVLLHRPWFEFDERPFPLLLHLFGYGPEFFQYVYPLERTPEADQWFREEYGFARDAHNDVLHRTVETGLFGLASYLLILAALLAAAVALLMGRRAIPTADYKLVLMALLASVGGRVVEQLVGIPHLTDVALFWSLLAVAVALPGVMGDRQPTEEQPASAGHVPALSSPGYPAVGGTVLRLSVALVLASVVVVFTMLQNLPYVLAEYKATSATTSLAQGDLPKAIRQIERAIALGPDVGRYHAKLARILDKGVATVAISENQLQLAQESYRASQRAVGKNPYDIAYRYQIARAALTLAGLGQDSLGQEAIGQAHRLIQMHPSFWPSYFLLATAYMELGQIQSAIEAYDEVIRLSPGFGWGYNQRGVAYAHLEQFQRAIEDYDHAIRVKPGFPDAYNQRGVAYYKLGRLLTAIENYDQAIRLNAELSSAYNNRGSAHHELGRLERAIEDYDEAIRLSPLSAGAYANRATAYHELGGFQQAIEDYSAAIKLNPRFAEAYVNRAIVYTRVEMDAEAEQDIDRAVQLGIGRTPLENSIKRLKNLR